MTQNETNQNFDLAIIGAGPGGYVAAIKAAQLGGKVALIEKGKVGGTCLNNGCIPTKSYYACAGINHNLRVAGKYGILVHTTPKVELRLIKERKDEIVERMQTGILSLLKSNQVSLFNGTAAITQVPATEKDDITLSIKGKENLELRCKKIILASGTKPGGLPDLDIDGKYVVTSDQVLNEIYIPSRLLIMGGGVVGCEFAQIFSRFGSKVTIVELMSDILPETDSQARNHVKKIFKQEGIDIITGTSVEKYHLVKVKTTVKNYQEMAVTLKDQRKIAVDQIMLSIGRKPCLENLFPVQNQPEMEDGLLKVDQFYRTSIPSIYAIGDIIPGPKLAHFASMVGEIAAINAIKGDQKTCIDPDLVPKVIYLEPEIAQVGPDEKVLKEKNIDTITGRFSIMANGMAQAIGREEGMIKIIAEKKSGRLLSGTIVSQEASALITTLTLAIKAGLTIEQIEDTVFPHPTFSEVIRECVLDAKNRAIHKATIKRRWVAC